MKFDSLKNNSSINSHIDKCLTGSTQMFMFEENKPSNLSNDEKKIPTQTSQTKAPVEKTTNNKKKRPENTLPEPTLELKKTKKTPNGGATLDKFFKKN